MENTRFNITMSEDMKEWYINKSKSYGMSISGLMVMALAQYREQQEAVRAMSDVRLLVKAQTQKQGGE